MLNWNYLETFVILSENLSFSQTAQILNTAQPGISRQIKVLEASLGYPLFIRSKKRVALSQEGLQLKLQLGPLVQEIKTLLELQTPQDELSGKIRIGSIMEAGHLIFFPKIRVLMETRPQLEIHFLMMSSRAANEAVLSGDLDFAFVYQVSDRKSLQAQVVFQDLPVLIAGKQMPRKWRDFARYPMISYRERDLYMEDFVQHNWSKTERKKMQQRLSINSHAEMIDFLNFQPNTMAVVPLSSAQQALEQGQIQILLKDKRPQDLYLICNEQILIDKRKKAFWNLMKKTFAKA